MNIDRFSMDSSSSGAQTTDCRGNDSLRQILLDLTSTKHPQVLKEPLLERLYYVLLHLSLGLSQKQYHCRDTHTIDILFFNRITKIHFIDVITLSDFLFKQIDRELEEFLRAEKFVPWTSTFNHAGPYADIVITSYFILLLRCCIKILPLLEFDLGIVREKCQLLIVALQKLCSLDCMLPGSGHKGGAGRVFTYSRRTISHECMVSPNIIITYHAETMDTHESCSLKESYATCLTKQMGPSVPSVCLALEVFADELLVHKKLRIFFLLANSDMFEKLFVCHESLGDIGTVLEVVSAHFLVSFSNELAFDKFVQTLFWSCHRDMEITEFSFRAAIMLLTTSLRFSTPQLLQAHLISVVSRCIGIKIAPADLKPNPEMLLNLMTTFEISVNLYTARISLLQPCDRRLQSNSESGSCDVEQGILGNGFCTSFESSILPATYNKIILQIHRFINSCNPSLHAVFSGTKSDLLRNSLAYVEENKDILDKMCRDEICSVLNCIILKVFSNSRWAKALPSIGELCQEEACLLAAILKLMSCSLLQILLFVRNNGSSKTLKDYSICREYDFIARIISCFGKYDVSRSIRRILCDALGRYPERHKKSKLMLMHFATVLMFSFERWPEFLQKGCIFVLMVLMNLLIFEEGNLDALKQLLECSEEYLFIPSSQAKLSQDLVCRRSSLMVASNFQKQMLYLREEPKLLISNIEGVEAPNTCKGEPFIKALLLNEKYDRLPPDYDDLADFIVCKPGKDYTEYLRKRSVFNSWVCERKSLKRCRRKIHSWIAGHK